MYKLTLVGHPQSNRKAEIMNMIILQDLKARLNQAKGLWIEKFYSILWAYQTMPQIPIGETPFNLAFRTEGVILVEIDLPSIKVEYYDESSNSDQQCADLDLIVKI